MQDTSLSTWYEKPPGSWLLKLECEETTQFLKKLHGDFLVQIGGTANMAHSVNKRFHYCYRLNGQYAFASETDIIADFQALPLLYNTVDVIMLIHVLEFVEHPTQFLQEIYQALAPGGQLIIIGFNPWSLLGMSQLLFRHSGVPAGKFWSRALIKRWLIDQSYTIIFNKTFCFRWPQQSAPAPWLHLFREALGQLCLPKAGNIYLIAAQKRIYHATKLLRQRWQKHPAFGRRVVEPIR